MSCMSSACLLENEESGKPNKFQPRNLRTLRGNFVNLCSSELNSGFAPVEILHRTYLGVRRVFHGAHESPGSLSNLILDPLENIFAYCVTKVFESGRGLARRNESGLRLRPASLFIDSIDEICTSRIRRTCPMAIVCLETPLKRFGADRRKVIAPISQSEQSWPIPVRYRWY